MKAYLASHTVPGYGPRIFIPYNAHTLEVRGMMEDLSTWGGSDKNTGKCFGYEFPSAKSFHGEGRFKQAQEWLKEKGFTLEEQSEHNTNDIWK